VEEVIAELGGLDALEEETIDMVDALVDQYLEDVL
jgi:hypothetical protein